MDEDEEGGEGDQRELDVQGAVRPAVEARGHRGAGGDQDRQGDEGAIAEAARHDAHVLGAAGDRHDGGDEDELAADEEGHGQQVQIADDRHPKRVEISPPIVRGLTP